MAADNPYLSPGEPEVQPERLSKSERLLFALVLALIAAMCWVLGRRLAA
jgi:hypothetical protein